MVIGALCSLGKEGLDMCILLLDIRYKIEVGTRCDSSCNISDCSQLYNWL